MGRSLSRSRYGQPAIDVRAIPPYLAFGEDELFFVWSAGLRLIGHRSRKMSLRESVPQERGYSEKFVRRSVPVLWCSISLTVTCFYATFCVFFFSDFLRRNPGSEIVLLIPSALATPVFVAAVTGIASPRLAASSAWWAITFIFAGGVPALFTVIVALIFRDGVGPAFLGAIGGPLFYLGTLVISAIQFWNRKSQQPNDVADERSDQHP